ncbi:BTAD domain-containing putative transcriptional regulator [Actinomycetes bacterium KLBMP 9797]
MRIQVLGPVRVWRGEEAIEVARFGPRVMLGLLALAVGRPLSRAELVDALWGQQPPPSAVNTLQTHVKHLRRLLEPQRRRYAPSTVLPAVGDGYALDLPADRIDFYRFRDLVGAAAAADRNGDPRRAVELLRQALESWQGPPLADLPSLAGHPKVVALAEQRRAALTHYGELLIAAGDPAAAVAVLEQVTAEQALDEVACALLIRAYHGTGRRAQAFTFYHQTRRRLIEQLGIDPGPELTAAHTALLQQDEATAIHNRQVQLHNGQSTAAGRRDGRPAAVHRPIPAQLPPDIPVFTGRADHLRQLDSRLSDATTVVISAVSGTAGVGKTTLAVHWAHRVRDRFPDGQLHVNLRGFDPVGPMVNTAEALRGFLDALRVPAHEIPTDLPAQTALYRSLLAGKRMLIILDNARDADQVRPLLPGAPGCVVVVTSRNRLASLVAVDGASPLVLGLLRVDEARQFLTRRLGHDRTAAEPRAVDQIIHASARLPLALAIVAARAATHPDFTLTALANQLDTAHDRLDALTGDDTATDVRAVFSWSYEALSGDARRLFRLLGLHPGPSISVPATASLAAISPARARTLLAELAHTSLINEYAPDRYGLHDLLRAYATELADAHCTRPDRHQAHRRLFDHHLHTAHDVATLLYPDPARITPPPASSDAAIEPLPDRSHALAWLTAELPVLLNSVRVAAETGFHTHCWQLVVMLTNHFQRWGRWRDWANASDIALRAAQREADLVGQAHAHRCLAAAHRYLDHHEEYETHIRRALDLFGELGDRVGLARAHHTASGASTDPVTAAHHAQQALTLYQVTRNRWGEASALNNASHAYRKLGDLAKARSHGEQAVAIFQEIGDPGSEANTWDSLGTIHHAGGDHQEAIGCFQRALALFRTLGERVAEANVLDRLGSVHLARGDRTAAGDAWRHALTIHDALGSPEVADALRARLGRLDHASDNHAARPEP